MQNAKGDDLERANRAFGRMTEDELDQLHGESGKTRRAIWDELKTARAHWEAANRYLEDLLG